MQQEDRDFYTSIQAARVRGKGVKNRRYPDAEEIIEEVPAPAKKQLDQAAVAAIDAARAEEAQRNATVMQEAYPEVEMEPIVPQTTRMAAPGRRNRLKDLDPEELEAYKALRAEALRERREKNQQAKARGERLRAPAYTEAPPPKKTREPPLSALLPTVQEVTGHEVAQWKKPRREVPRVGIAQRLGHAYARKIQGLVGRFIRLKEHPTVQEKNMKVKGGRTLQQARMQAIMRQAKDLKWELEQDGFDKFLRDLPYDKTHYIQSTTPKDSFYTNLKAVAGPQQSMDPTRHFVGAHYGGEYGNVLY